VIPTVWSTDGMTQDNQSIQRKNPSWCQSVHCKPHMDWSGTKLRPLS